MDSGEMLGELFTTKDTKHTKFGEAFFYLRALRVLRGLIFLFSFASPISLYAQDPLRAGTIFSATQAPLWAAREGRYFEKYGIKNLEVIQFSGGQPVTRGLIGGGHTTHT